jgi:hypothetical protein
MLLGQNAFMIMSWETGKILYDSDAGPQEKTIDISTETIAPQLVLQNISRKSGGDPSKISFPSFFVKERRG